MGRGRVYLRRIEDKNKRQVTFSKRRRGLVKKAQELSVLCDADLALVILTPHGRSYEFSSGNNLNVLLERYWTHADKNSANNEGQPEKNQQECTASCERNSMLHSVQRFFEGKTVEQLDVCVLIQLEQLLVATLRETRNRKTQLMMESLQALHEKPKTEHKNEKQRCSCLATTTTTSAKIGAARHGMKLVEPNRRPRRPDLQQSVLLFHRRRSKEAGVMREHNESLQICEEGAKTNRSFFS